MPINNKELGTYRRPYVDYCDEVLYHIYNKVYITPNVELTDSLLDIKNHLNKRLISYYLPRYFPNKGFISDIKNDMVDNELPRH